MSCGDTISNAAANGLGPRSFNAQANTMRAGIQFATLVVPVGTAVLNLTTSYGQYVLPAAETLPSVTWNLPSAASAPGAFFALVNSSTVSTVTVVAAPGDTAQVTTVGPSAGVGQAAFFPLWSDSISAWNA
jgi:hypothetical protein